MTVFGIFQFREVKVKCFWDAEMLFSQKYPWSGIFLALFLAFTAM